MTLLLVGTYKKFDTNEYVELLADAYMKQGIQVIFEEQNFLFSNFIPDIVHVQWPESIYRWKKLVSMDQTGLNYILQKLRWYKNNNVTIIYTVHNLQPHDISSEFDYLIYSGFLKYTDIIVHHGKNSIDMIKTSYKETMFSKHIIAHHGAYRTYNIPEKNSIKEKYGLPKDKIICTNFGLQRGYKGGNFNIDVFKRLNDQGICYFAVGGLVGDSKPFEISQEELCHRQLYQRIPSNEVVDIIAVTDVFFLGHSSGLNSGLISLAISYCKPIVFPNIGNFKEQADGWEYHETYDVENVESAVAAVTNMFMKLKNNDNFKFNNEEWLKKNSWNDHANIILNEVKTIRMNNI